MLVLSGFCVVLYLNRDRFSEAEIDLLPLMAVASSLFLVSRVAVASATFMTLRSNASTVRFIPLILLDLSTSFINYLPMKAGLFVKALYLKTVEDIEYSKFAASIFMVNSAQIMTAMALALLAGAFFVQSGAQEISRQSVLLVIAALLIVLMFFSIGALSKMILRFGVFHRHVNAWARSVSSMNSSIREISTQAVLGVTVGLLVSVRLYLCFLMVGTTVSIFAAILMAMLAVPARLVAIMPGGIGVREAMIVGGGFLAGIPLELALAAASLDRLIQFSTLTLVGGIAIVPLNRRFRSALERQEQLRGKWPNL